MTALYYSEGVEFCTTQQKRKTFEWKTAEQDDKETKARQDFPKRGSTMKKTNNNCRVGILLQHHRDALASEAQAAWSPIV